MLSTGYPFKHRLDEIPERKRLTSDGRLVTVSRDEKYFTEAGERRIVRRLNEAAHRKVRVFLKKVPLQDGGGEEVERLNSILAQKATQLISLT
jgi:hypothetical protein